MVFVAGFEDGTGLGLLERFLSARPDIRYAWKRSRAVWQISCGRFTFHVEATDKVSELIELVKSKGMGVGVALKPGTPVEVRGFPALSTEAIGVRFCCCRWWWWCSE